jgi:hypothetical protein
MRRHGRKAKSLKIYDQWHSNLADCSGRAVSKAFPEKMSMMARKIGAGTGFTEFP